MHRRPLVLLSLAGALVACADALPVEPMEEPEAVLEEAPAPPPPPAFACATAAASVTAGVAAPDPYCNSAAHLAPYKGKAGPTIRLRFHVLVKNGQSALAPATLKSWLAQANDVFGPEVQFKASGTTKKLTSAAYFDLAPASFKDLVLQQDDPAAIDVYVVHSFGPLCGQATAIGAGLQQDAVVVSAACGPLAFAHELGHLFGLFHTHHPQGGTACATSGDHCCDTVMDPGPAAAAGEGAGTCKGGWAPYCQASCPGGVKPDATNLMSYYPCGTKSNAAHLSPCQAARAACHADRQYAYARVDP